MAATVRGTFELIDKASGTLDKIWRQSKKAETALTALGQKLDATETKLNKTAAAAQGLASELNNVAGTYKVKIETTGMTSAAAQAKALNHELDAIERKSRTGGKTGLIGKIFGALPTGGNSTLEAMLGSLERRVTTFTRATKPLSMALGGVTGGLLGMATAFPPLITLMIVALPLIIGLAAGLAALTLSLGAAVGGALAIGGGVLGAFAVGIGSIVAVVKPAINDLKAYEKATTALTKAQNAGNPQAIKRAADQVNRLGNAHPGVAKLAAELKGLGSAMRGATTGARNSFFSIASDGVATLRHGITQLGKEAGPNMKALHTALEPLIGPKGLFNSKSFDQFIRVMSKTFRDSIKQLGPGLRDLGHGIMQIMDVAGPRVTNGFAKLRGLFKDFDTFFSSKKGHDFVNTMIDSFKTWVDLIGSVAKLLGTLIFNATDKQGKQVGDSPVVALTKNINDLTDKINKNPDAFRKWLGDGIKTMTDVASAIGSIARALEDIASAIPNVTGVIKTLAPFAPELLGAYALFKVGAGGAKGVKGVKGAYDKVLGSGGRGDNALKPVYVFDTSGGKRSPGSKPPVIPTPAKKAADVAKDAVKKVLPYVPAATGAGTAAVIGHLVGEHVVPHAARSVQNETVAGGNKPLDNLGDSSPGGWSKTLSLTLNALGLHPGEKPMGVGGRNVNPVGVRGSAGNSTATRLVADLGTAQRIVKQRTDAIQQYHADMAAGLKGPAADVKKTLDDLNSKYDSVTKAIQTDMETVQKSTKTNVDGLVQSMMAGLGLIKAAPSSGSIGRGALDMPSKPKSAGQATGGRLQGQGLRDTIPLVGTNTLAAPGELVVNRHTEHKVNALLGAHGTTLGSMVNGEARPHNAATGTRVQGRRAQTSGSTIGHPELHSGISKAVGMLLGQFPNLSVTSTTGGGHATNSYHYLGEAADLGGAPEVMNLAASWAKSHLGSSLTEGIHNPNLSIKNGQSVPASFWGGATWAAHANHIHLAVAGALANIAGLSGAGAAPHLKRKTVAGSGLPQKIGQAASDKALKAAQKVLNNAAAGGGVYDNAAGGLASAGGAYNKSMLKALWIREGGDPSVANLMAAIALAESAGNPSIVNSIGATGLWQIHPGGKQYLNPAANARTAISKYGSQGLGAWEAYTNGSYRRYMQTGGRTGDPQWGGWFGDGGSFTAHRPTYIGVGEKGTEKVTVTPAGQGGAASKTFHIAQLVVHGNDKVKDEVKKAFHELEREMSLHHGVDE